MSFQGYYVFLGWGRAWTDKEGRYEFHTVMPAATVTLRRPARPKSSPSSAPASCAG